MGELMGDKDYFSKICLCKPIWVLSLHLWWQFLMLGLRVGGYTFTKGNPCSAFRQVSIVLENSFWICWFSVAFLVAQTESACNAGDPGSILELGKIPWKREWEPTPVFLPGKSHGQRSLVGYSPWGHKESEKTEWLTLSLSEQSLW